MKFLQGFIEEHDLQALQQIVLRYTKIATINQMDKLKKWVEDKLNPFMWRLYELKGESRLSTEISKGVWSKRPLINQISAKMVISCFENGDSTQLTRPRVRYQQKSAGTAG